MTESSSGSGTAEHHIDDTIASVAAANDSRRTGSSQTIRNGVRRLADTGSPALLWIDDEKSASDPDIRWLEHEGFRIECAVTGIEGLALARTGNYRAILLDLRLPDIPGLSVLAHLRANKITTPVLVVTGFGDFESVQVAGQLGVAGFHVKDSPAAIGVPRCYKRGAVTRCPAEADQLHFSLRLLRGLSLPIWWTKHERVRIKTWAQVARRERALPETFEKHEFCSVVLRHPTWMVKRTFGRVSRGLGVPSFHACILCTRS